MKLSATTRLSAAAAAYRVRPVYGKFLGLRRYATQDSLGGDAAADPATRRKAVTPFNDDGHVPWTQLSTGEKAGRAAQQSFNWGLVLLGAMMTGGVGYFLFREVFSTDSKVAYFNRAVSRIRKDPRCLQALGDGQKISAHGEETWNKWRRARPIASSLKQDQLGNDHLVMHFHVEGPRNRGTAYLHLTRKKGQKDYEYTYFYVDVPGQARIYLEKAEDAAAAKAQSGKGLTMFGVKWT